MAAIVSQAAAQISQSPRDLCNMIPDEDQKATCLSNLESLPSNGEITENPFSNEEFTDAFNSAASTGTSIVGIILGLVFGLCFLTIGIIICCCCCAVKVAGDEFQRQANVA